MPVEIEIAGLADALDMFMQGNERIGRALKVGMKSALKLIHGRISTYPRPSGRSQPFVSDKQRRFFFAAVRDGRIQVPYRRTKTLRKWTQEVRFTDNDMMGFVGSTAPYAPLVQGFGTQAAYHEGTWQTDKDVMEASQDEVLEIFATVISSAMAQE